MLILVANQVHHLDAVLESRAKSDPVVFRNKEALGSCIACFPTSFGNLTTQKVLCFNDKFFVEFSDRLLSLKNLDNPNFSRNRVQRIPSALSALDKHKLQAITENPWTPNSILTLVKKIRANGTLVPLTSNEAERAIS